MQFSVLLSVYNKEVPENLNLALNSIIEQTILPNEIILVMDGFINPLLMNVINDFQLKCNLFHTIPLKNNVGLGVALKIGLDNCNFEWVARMDTDDICYPNRFEKQIEFIENNPDISVLGTYIQEFNMKPGDLNVFKKGSISNHFKFAKSRNPLNHMTVFFNKFHVQNVGSYQHMPDFEDYYLWVRMLVSGYKIQNILTPLVHVKIGNDMIGRRHGLRYFSNEFHFLRSIYKLNFLNLPELCFQVMLKFPIRVLPKFLIKIIYKTVLR